jgi:hypothetical protein
MKAVQTAFSNLNKEMLDQAMRLWLDDIEAINRDNVSMAAEDITIHMFGQMLYEHQRRTSQEMSPKKTSEKRIKQERKSEKDDPARADQPARDSQPMFQSYTQPHQQWQSDAQQPMEEKGVQVTNFPKVDIHFDP